MNGTLTARFKNRNMKESDFTAVEALGSFSLLIIASKCNSSGLSIINRISCLLAGRCQQELIWKGMASPHWQLLEDQALGTWPPLLQQLLYISLDG